MIRGARLQSDPLLLALALQHAVELAPGEGFEEAAAAVDLISPETKRIEELTTALQALEAQCQQAMDAGYNEGYVEGFKRGEEDGRAIYEEAVTRAESEHAASLSALMKLLQGVEARLKESIEGAENLLVEIAFEGLCKILSEALIDRDGVVAAVRTAMVRLRDRERVVVRLSPHDLALLEGYRDLEHETEQKSRLDWVADERIALGGCLLETSGGTLDARIETQIQSLREVLLGVQRRAA